MLFQPGIKPNWHGASADGRIRRIPQSVDNYNRLDMLKLTDIKETSLRNLATELGLPATGTVAELTAAIKQRLAPNSALVFVPLVPGTPASGSGRGALFVSFIGVGIALAALLVNWISLHATLDKNATDLREAKEAEWQTTIVHSIIDDATKDDASGVPFQKILDTYQTKALAEKSVSLGKDKLQPIELRRILLNLMQTNAIYGLVGDRYFPARGVVVPGVEKPYIESRIISTIVQVLSSEGGRYTVTELEPKVTDIAKVTQQDYNTVINSLIVQKAVIPDDKGKLWSAAKPPPLKR
jgi:hypothetical protein